MKKTSTYFFIILLSIIVFLLAFSHNTNKKPNAYYQVYLDDEVIGVIESKEELENYINSQADTIRENVRKYKLKIDAIDTLKEYESKMPITTYSALEKVNYLIINKDLYNLTDFDVDNLKFYKKEKLYNYKESEINEMRDYINKNEIYQHVEEVYTPLGIEIKKLYTYNGNIKTVEKIYKEIIFKKSCTISGYKFIIKSKDQNISDIEIYTIDKNIFSNAIEDLITIFVNEEQYKLYKKGKQEGISTTGSIIDNIYVEQEITYKAVNIPIEEKIYTDVNELTAYLLYGDKFEQRTVQVKTGDSIETLAIENEISVQEFLIFNPQYTSRDNLLVAGTDVIISNVDPKIQVVVETFEVVDKETMYEVVEEYDANLNKGSKVVAQEGENGLERVSQNVKTINGEIAYVDPEGKETLKNSVPRVIKIGTKYIPNVGSVGSWGWPTESGYTISSYYGYRILQGKREFHNALDIAGTGYGSKIFAANNGVIETRTYNSSYGNYIIINHNNGYYTLYAHMSYFDDRFTVGSTVSRGEVIGYVGSTGRAFGPHLHYEIRTCEKYSCTTNPLLYYR